MFYTSEKEANEAAEKLLELMASGWESIVYELEEGWSFRLVGYGMSVYATTDRQLNLSAHECVRCSAYMRDICCDNPRICTDEDGSRVCTYDMRKRCQQGGMIDQKEIYKERQK